MACVGKIIRESTREERAENLPAIKMKARTVMRRGEESLLWHVTPDLSYDCDRRERESKGAKGMNGKNKTKTQGHV